MAEPIKLQVDLVGGDQVTAGIARLGTASTELGRVLGAALETMRGAMDRFVARSGSQIQEGAERAATVTVAMAERGQHATEKAAAAGAVAEESGAARMVVAAQNAAQAVTTATQAAGAAAQRAHTEAAQAAEAAAARTQQAYSKIEQEIRARLDLARGQGIASTAGRDLSTRSRVQAADAGSALPRVSPSVSPEVGDAIKKSEQELDDLHKTAQRTGQGLRELVDSSFSLVGVQSPLQSQLAQSARAALTFSEGSTVAAGGVGALLTSVVAGGVGVVAIGAALFEAARGAAAYTDAMGKQATRSGVGVESFSRLNYAAKLSEVSTEELKGALEKVGSQALKESEAFKVLGVETENAAGEQRDAGEIFLDVADRFASYRDGIAKTTLAQALFGQSGNDLLPFLNQGRAGIEALGQQLDNYGGTVTPQASAAGNALGDSLTRLETAASSLRLMMGTRLVPVVTDLLELLVRATSDTGSLGIAMDLLVRPIERVRDSLSFLADYWDLTAAATGRFLKSSALALQGDFAGARKLMDGATQDVERFTKAREKALGVVPPAPVNEPGKVETPVLPTAAQKAAKKAAEQALEIERKRQADLIALRDRGAVELESIQASGERQKLDEQMAKERISFAEYYAERAALIQAEYERKLELASIVWNREEDSQKAEAQREIEAAKALAEKTNAEAALGRERQLQEEKLDESLRKSLEEIERFAEKEANRIKKLESDIDEIRARRRRRDAADQISRVEEDPTLDTGRKRTQVIGLLKQEAAALREEAVAAEQLSRSSNIDERLKGEKELERVHSQEEQVQQRLIQLQRPGFLVSLRKQIRDLSDEWAQFGANTAKALTNGVSSAVGAVSDEITNAIFKTAEWGQAFARVGQSIVGDLVKVSVQWIAQRTLMHGLEMLFGGQRKAAAKEELVVNTTNAGVAAGSSWGISAIVGLAAFLALMGAVAGFAGAFAGGGWIRGKGGPTEDNLVAAVSAGEHVTKAQAAARHPELLEAINADAPREELGRILGRQTSQEGGFLPSSAAIDRPRPTGLPALNRERAVVGTLGTPAWEGMLSSVRSALADAARLDPVLRTPDYGLAGRHQAAVAAQTGRAQAAAMPEIKAPPAEVHVYYANTEGQVHEIIQKHPAARIIQHQARRARGSWGAEI